MSRLYGLVPAAGSGSRMGEATPKQYLPLAGATVLHHAIAALLAHDAVERVCVVLAPGDAHFDRHDWSAYGDRLLASRTGGETRADSVLNGLRAMAGFAHDDDWVLVHDAARPCLSRGDLARLVETLRGDTVGGLLAAPVADTLKRDDGSGRVGETVPRAGIWQAHTPQMFRYRLLLDALAAADRAAVTDEASAIEARGLRPRLVPGSPRNLKVTYPDDLRLAGLILGAATTEEP